MDLNMVNPAVFGALGLNIGALGALAGHKLSKSLENKAYDKGATKALLGIKSKGAKKAIGLLAGLGALGSAGAAIGRNVRGVSLPSTGALRRQIRKRMSKHAEHSLQYNWGTDDPVLADARAKATRASLLGATLVGPAAFLALRNRHLAQELGRAHGATAYMPRGLQKAVGASRAAVGAAAAYGTYNLAKKMMRKAHLQRMFSEATKKAQ
jgi:hypothetical protein